MFDSAWGKRVSGFAAPVAIALLLCASLIAVLLCAALPKTQVAHADDMPQHPDDTPQSYQLWWGESSDDGGSITVEDASGNVLLPGAMVESGTEITVQCNPDDGMILWGAFAYTGDPRFDENRIDSTLSNNSFSFVMPTELVNIYFSFTEEIASVGYMMRGHGYTLITNEAGEEVNEAKCGETLNVAFIPSTGYYLKSAKLDYHGLWEEKSIVLPIVNEESSFVVPMGGAIVDAEFVRDDGKYEVSTYAHANGGTIVSQDKKGNEEYFFKPGDTVYISCEPNVGCVVTELFVDAENGEILEIKSEKDGLYSFKMPEATVHVSCDFSPENGGADIWLQESIAPAGSVIYPGDGSLLGDVWCVDSEGKKIAGQKPGERVEVCVSLNDDKHFVQEMRYAYTEESVEGWPEPKNVLIEPVDGRYIFTMPQCLDVTVEVTYGRYDDGVFDISYSSLQARTEDLSVRITNSVGQEINSAAAGERVRFEYLPDGEFTLSYMKNYLDPAAKEVTVFKLNHSTFEFIMPAGPLHIDFDVARIDVRTHTDDTVYIPEKGKDEARIVAQGLFKKLVETGEVPKGMQKRSAEAFRNMIKGADDSGLYVGMVVKAKDSIANEAERLLLLEVTEEDELIVHTFDLSVEFGMTTGDGYSSSAELTELVEGIQFQLMPDGADGKFVRIVRIHDGAVEDVPVIEVNEDGYIIDADRFSTYSVLAADTTTVSFESNGGSAVASQEVGYGQKLAKPADPTREGYVFEGWYADEALTVAYDFEAPVVQHLGTLYAKWSAEGSGSTSGAGGGNAGAGQASGDSIAKTGDASGLTVAFLGFAALAAASAAAVARRWVG